jgi:Rrf2 family protein
MAHITTSVEYAIHGLLWLIGNDPKALSTREIADLQGISPTFLAKIFPKLEKAGIVTSKPGIRGGYLLARAPKDISFLDIVVAVEGEKPLFDCTEVRKRCVLFEGEAPTWASSGTCAIHSIMIKADKAMRESLANHTLADVATGFGQTAPSEFFEQVQDWVGVRTDSRTARITKTASGTSN